MVIIVPSKHVINLKCYSIFPEHIEFQLLLLLYIIIYYYTAIFYVKIKINKIKKTVNILCM